MSFFRDAGKNRDYPDWYELYKRNNKNTAFDLKNIEPVGKFRAKDVVDYYEVEEQLNGVSSKTRKYLTIETPARLTFNPGDILKNIKDGQEWRVKKATTSDSNKAKDKSMRPIKVTILELWA